jgi:hypothetical protein
MMKRLLLLPQRAPRAALLVTVLLTAFFGWFAQSIRVDSSMENLLPADDPDRLYYDEVERVFGSEEISVIGVFADNVFAPTTLAKIDRVSTEISQIKGVEEVLSITTVKGVEVGDFGLATGRLMKELPRTEEEAAAFRERVFANPLLIKNIVSADGRAAGISVVYEPMNDQEFIESGIEGRIRELIKGYEGPERFAITGIPTLKVQGAHLMQTDIMKFMPLSTILVVIVLAFSFRTVRGVLLPLVTVVVGVIWTTGLMVLTGSAITMGTLVLPPLLMAIGIAYAIHIVSHYYQQLETGNPKEEVIRASIDHVSMPVLIAAVTTLIGFATFTFTPIRAVREFGYYSVFGITVILIISFAIIPAALLLLPQERPRSKSEGGGRLSDLLGGFADGVVRNRWAVAALSLAICVGSAWGMRWVRVETNYLLFFSPSSDVRIDNELISSQLAGTQPLYVVIDGDGPQSVTRLENLQAMRELQTFIERQPGVDKTLSLLDYLTLVRGVLDPEAPLMPKSQAEIDQILLLINPTDVQAVLNRDYSRANVIARTSLSGSAEVGQLVERVEEFAAKHFPGKTSVRCTGTMVLLNRSADALAKGQIGGLWQVLLVLAILMSLLFLSVRVGLLSLIPNVVPIIILFGLMGWFGISLNISTSLIAAIALGIAIDDTIHYLSCFNGEMRRVGSQEQAVVSAMRLVGQPMVFTSIALAVGFFIVCLSNFQPVQHFGFLSGITMIVALFSDLCVTPTIAATTKIITLWDLLYLKLGPEPHKQIPLFTGLRPFQAKIVVLMGHLASAAKGAFIARQGELKTELYVLLSGRADVRRGEGGPPIRILSRGDVVGEMGLVRERPRSADVVISEDAEYLVLDRRFLQRLRRRYPRIASTVFLNLTRILSDRLESTTDVLAGMKTQTESSSPPAN